MHRGAGPGACLGAVKLRFAACFQSNPESDQIPCYQAFPTDQLGKMKFELAVKHLGDPVPVSRQSTTALGVQLTESPRKLMASLYRGEL